MSAGDSSQIRRRKSWWRWMVVMSKAEEKDKVEKGRNKGKDGETEGRGE